jgi:DNA primase
MPLRWSEVGRKLDPSKFTLATARRRLEKMSEDPVRPVLERRPDLLGALTRLGERLAEPRSRSRPAETRRSGRGRPKVR